MTPTLRCSACTPCWAPKAWAAPQRARCAARPPARKRPLSPHAQQYFHTGFTDVHAQSEVERGGDGMVNIGSSGMQW
jgi:hypothetical protein